MWLRRGWIVVLAAQAALGALGPCARLRGRWPRARTDILVRVQTNEFPVTVWGEGGGPRAAAALLVILLRDVMGFSAHLHVATANLCDLSDISNWQKCSKCVAVLARNETKHDSHISAELQRRIELLDLPLEIVYFETDALLRKEVFKLKKDNKSFIFLDEDIWTNVSNILRLDPPQCVDSSSHCSCGLDPRKVVRIGDGKFMRRFANPVADLVSRFSPKFEDLRQILENEIYLDDFKIDEAACDWALKNEKKIENWTSITNKPRYPPVYVIKVYLCNDDPDIDEHLHILNVTGLMLWNDIKEMDFSVKTIMIDCLDRENLRWEFFSLAREERIAGAVAWGWSVTTEIAKAAEYAQMPLMLAGPTFPDILLESTFAVHSVSGTQNHLTEAYLELIQLCEWTRVAIISDNTSYSKYFTDTLLSKTELVARERVIDSSDITEISNTLKRFLDEDARIFLINTNWLFARNILNAAQELKMTPESGFMWIVRDWRASKNTTLQKDWGKMYHFTLGTTWRGGQTAGGSKFLQTELHKLWQTTGADLNGSAGSASLADALLLLGHGFAKFLREYPSHIYDLHGLGNARNFSKSLQNVVINGSAQTLKGESAEIVVFIEKWSESRGSTVALWRVSSRGVRTLWDNETHSCKDLLGSQPTDRRACATLTTGDLFAPRCHDLTFVIVFIVLILASLFLFMARLARLSRLRRREKEESQRVATWLDSYLVSRNSIRLFHVIGSGSNGKVRFAELKLKPGETLLVAAKEPRESVSLFEVNEFLREACVLAPLRHENVIRLIGVCVADGPPIVLMEHAYYSDLQRYLTFRRQFAIRAGLGEVTAEEAMEVSDAELTRFAREAARALEYLAAKRLVHRDVRAANCLVDKNRSLKLADFGLARELDTEETQYMTTRRGLFPVLWMPPESFKEGLFSTASDVWALGVLILEVATLGARPYGNWSREQVILYVRSGGHPPLPPDTSKQTRSLVLACWQLDVKSRPTPEFVHEFLTRNPQAISPALLSPNVPEPYLYFTRNNRKSEEIDRRRNSCAFISMQF